MTETKLLTLRPGTWYGWHLFPGYAGVPWTSPIYVRYLKPKGGKRLFVDYRDAGYAQGVQEREETTKVLARGEHHVTILRPDQQVGVIVPMTAEWLKKSVPMLTGIRADEEPADFLDRTFNERSAG